MMGFNSTMSYNFITLKELFDIYNYFCDCKGEVSFNQYILDFLKLNPGYRLIK